MQLARLTFCCAVCHAALLLVCRIRVINAATRIISTYAGSTQGFAGDGQTVASAKFAFPYSVAISSARMMAVSDFNNGRIRLINMTSGAVSTLAGGGTSNSTEDVLGTAAKLVAPWAVAFNSRGDLAIADDMRVQMVFAANRTIRTIAGNLTKGFAGDGGPATAALLQGAVSVAFDARDNLFVGMSNAVRRIDAATGIITTVAGTGDTTGANNVDNSPAIKARVVNPRGLAVDGAGVLYLMDYSSSVARVKKVWCP